MDAILMPALSQSVLFFPLCFGLYLTYRIMKITDLTVEATFVTGAGVYPHLLVLHYSLGLAVLVALLISGCVGLVVAVMQRISKLDALIVSILAIFMMYSVNMGLMGRPNISLLMVNDAADRLNNLHPQALWILLTSMVLLIGVALMIMLKTRLGLLFRAFGDNRLLLKQLRVPDFLVLACGLVLSNMLAALSGVMTAQINGYADINMSPGIALTAIGAVIIGLNLVSMIQKDHRFQPLLEIAGCIIGVIFYFTIMNALLVIGVNPLYMKCMLGIVLLFFLSTQQLASKKGAA